MAVTTLDDLDTVVHTFRFSERLPKPLPSFHVTQAEYFARIIQRQALEPQRTDDFGEDILFLFYGGAFYRTEDEILRKVGKLPVAFMFDPYVLEEDISFFPFDTGALGAGHYGSAGSIITPMDRFRVTGQRNYEVPCKMVRLIFNTNRRYWKADPDKKCKTKPNPLPCLYEFMSADSTTDGADRRKFSIECHATQPIILDKRLIWVAFPESLFKDYALLSDLLRPHQPETYRYSYPKMFCPREIAAHLEFEAQKFVKQRYY